MVVLLEVTDIKYRGRRECLLHLYGQAREPIHGFPLRVTLTETEAAIESHYILLLLRVALTRTRTTTQSAATGLQGHDILSTA